MDKIKIAAFGCWNRKVEEDDQIPMVRVMNDIKSREAEYTDLIILGDNYYAQKEKILIDGELVKKLYHKQEDLEYGFDLVENINIKNKYLIMGNHDIADTIKQDCIGLSTQCEKSGKFNVMFPFDFKIIELNDGTRIKYIFIDTTIYSIKGDQTCYDKVLGKTAQTIIQEQTQFIINQLNDPTIKFFLIFGHEPLYSIKTKLDEQNQKYYISDSILHELTELILNNSLDKNILYICADVHMYQSGIISNEAGNCVKQVVCCTGGAEQDHFVLGGNTFIKDRFRYDINITKDSYGYVEFVIDANDIKYKYVNILSDGTTKVYNKKYYIQYK